MVGRLCSFWNGHFVGDMLVFGVYKGIQYKLVIRRDLWLYLVTRYDGKLLLALPQLLLNRGPSERSKWTYKCPKKVKSSEAPSAHGDFIRLRVKLFVAKPFPSHSHILSKRFKTTKRTKCLGLSLGVFWALTDRMKAWIASDPCVDMRGKNSLPTSSLDLECVGVRWRLCVV